MEMLNTKKISIYKIRNVFMTSYMNFQLNKQAVLKLYKSNDVFPVSLKKKWNDRKNS